jgi:metal-dependent hydrolase (beta-lactamase superfamily II)
MKVTKFAHSCFLIEDLGQKILIDPGIYSDQQNQLIDLNFVLITHEHPDHFDIDSIKQIISNNPTVKIITNTAVKKILDAENIISLILEDGNSLNENERENGMSPIKERILRLQFIIEDAHLDSKRLNTDHFSSLFDSITPEGCLEAIANYRSSISSQDKHNNFKKTRGKVISSFL